jgi:membrane-associated phospholipid phosphatase
MAADALVLYSTISVICAVMSYLAMQHSAAFADDLLGRADGALGLSWPVIRHALDAHPEAIAVLQCSYSACFLMPVVVIVSLSAAGEAGRFYSYIKAHLIALLMTIAVALWLPAKAAFVHYRYAHLPGNAIDYGRAIAGLRDGSLRAIDLTHLAGIITFPSFHATMAILFTWAIWPVGRVRWLASAINSLMWLSAVPIGGHYGVDLLGGSLVALIAIMLAPPSGAGAWLGSIGKILGPQGRFRDRRPEA